MIGHVSEDYEFICVSKESELENDEVYASYNIRYSRTSVLIKDSLGYLYILLVFTTLKERILPAPIESISSVQLCIDIFNIYQ